MKIQDKQTSPKFTLDGNGYLVTTAKLARIGAMQYLGEEIGKESGKVYDVHVDPDDLFNDATVKSFENMPVTIEHPTEMYVDANNWQELAVGHISNIRKDETGEFLIGDVVVNSPKAIKIIQDGKIEVSCGYDADLVDADGKIKKANIKGNHLAIVNEGRCGDKCKLGDGKPMMKKQTLASMILARLGKKSPVVLATKIGDAKKRLGDAKGELKQKLADLEEVVQSDAPVEEKAQAIAELSEEAVALTEEITEVNEAITTLSQEIEKEAPAETTANDELTAEESEKLADLEAQVAEKDAKIAELEAELETLKEAEEKATTANDAKRVFGDKIAIKDSMSSVEIKRAVVASTGAYTKETVKTLADCALNSAYAAALTVSAKTNNVGKKLIGDSKPVAKQLPKSLRGKN